MSGLISLLAVQEIKVPFKSMKDLKQYTEFKIGVFGKGSTMATIRRFTEENDMEREFANFISPIYTFAPSNIKEWLIENKSPNVAFVSESDTMDSF